MGAGKADVEVVAAVGCVAVRALAHEVGYLGYAHLRCVGWGVKRWMGVAGVDGVMG